MCKAGFAGDDAPRAVFRESPESGRQCPELAKTLATGARMP